MGAGTWEQVWELAAGSSWEQARSWELWQRENHQMKASAGSRELAARCTESWQEVAESRGGDKTTDQKLQVEIKPNPASWEQGCRWLAAGTQEPWKLGAESKGGDKTTNQILTKHTLY